MSDMVIAGVLICCIKQSNCVCAVIGSCGWRCHTVAHYISEECISCGSCAQECPVEAISEGDGRYEIDPDICTDCGACEDVCPVEAVKAK